jgi:mannose-6-phosphate isomerase
MAGVVRHYAWGGIEFIPRLLGVPNPERRPFAELWLGAHPSASATVEVDGTRVTLTDLIRESPRAILGPEVMARFGSQLPFLLKVLDARDMLSIQVHPDAHQAGAGFESENRAGVRLDAPERNYKDRNPKPEVQVALTPFWMLHGFRPLEDLAGRFESTPELRLILPNFAERMRVAAADSESRSGLLRELYTRVLTMPQSEVDLILNPLLDRLERQGASCEAGEPGYWALRAARTFARPDGTRDRGLFSIFLLNLVRLDPGEGTFQAAGVPHAYLEGATVELMANSDNVLRCGLTSKHVDVPELLRVVQFEEGQPERLHGLASSPFEVAFPTSAREFELRRVRLEQGRPLSCPRASGPEVLLLLEGRVRIATGGHELVLGRGQGAFVPWDVAHQLEAIDGPATLFRAVVPHPRDSATVVPRS